MTIMFLEGLLDHIRKTNVVVSKEMEEDQSITPQLLKYDVPNELIHRIQSLLPAKDAARTCILSKSWLYAWSTIPTLRFTKCVPRRYRAKQAQADYMQIIDRTLLRYRNENMSIECFHLHLDIHHSSLPYPLEKWFQALASTNHSLKEISLTMCRKKRVMSPNDGRLTLPDAIFSCENLDTLSLEADSIEGIHQLIRVNTNLVIKCSLLRVVKLYHVCISDEALHKLFSSCTLLEKIDIDIDFEYFNYLQKIKVENLRFLRELKLNSYYSHMLELEIYGVPSLRLLSYSYCNIIRLYTTLRMDTLGSVRELVLLRVTIDRAFSDMINSKFPFLKTLNLSISHCGLETIHITCVSLKRLTLSMISNREINIQVYASGLLYFSYDGRKMPTLFFPSNTPAHIRLVLRFREHNPIDLFYFIKVREALDLSSNFDIEAIGDFVPSNIDLDDFRRMVPFPSRNVQQLSFGKHWQQKLRKHTPLLDFLFSICYPRYIKAYYRSPSSKNYWYKQMVQIMKKKMHDLIDIEVKNPRDGTWEILTNSLRRSRFLVELPWRNYINAEGNDYNSDEFKMNWLS